MTIWKENYAFDILNEIIEYVTLIQLMDSLGNLNHTISIVGNWIFDSKYKKAICLTQESSDIICSPSVGEEKFAMFRSVFHAVRYIWEPISLKKG